MSAFFSGLLFIFAGSSHAGEAGGFTHFWNTYFNYPGFELWKFINLAVFVGLLIYLLKKPLSQSFRVKREIIRAELIKAEEQRRTALGKLTEAEAKLAGLDREVATINEKAAAEAALEKSRIAEQADSEINKIRSQTENEINQTARAAQTELRKFSAEESIRRAEEIIKSRMNVETDSRITQNSIQSLGGLN